MVWGFARTAALGAGSIEVAEQLVELSPSDPQTHYTAAVIHERTFEPGGLEAALREYETAAALAPNNYALWLALGTARSRIGDEVGAEAALRRASQLAPNYARVHWALGNFLLRKGEDDEAYARMAKAIEADAAYAAPAASIALLMSDGHVETVRSRFGDSPVIMSALAVQLAEQKRFDEASDVWTGIGTGTNEKVRELGVKLRNLFIDARRFRDAVGVTRSLAADGPAVGKVSNAGFERPVKLDAAEPFDWQIGPENNPQIGLTEGQKVAGNYSLILIFGPAAVPSLRRLSQLVAVEPASQYRLEFSFRTDLTSRVGLRWEVVNVVDGKQLAVSQTLPDKAEWTRTAVNFETPAGVDGVEIRLLRSDCYGSQCMTSGSVWFDEFSLTRQTEQ